MPNGGGRSCPPNVCGTRGRLVLRTRTGVPRKGFTTMNAQPVARRSPRTKMQTAALIVSGAFLLVGILGFIPGITTNYDQMEFAGHESGAMLLDVFEVSVLHNIVHLLFGVVGLVLARTWSGARAFLIGGGVIYLLLWLYGILIDSQSDANFVPLNDADNWLHLGLGVGMFALGVLLSGEDRSHARVDLTSKESRNRTGRRP